MGWNKWTNLFVTNKNHSLVKKDDTIYMTGGFNNEYLIHNRDVSEKDWDLFYNFSDDTNYRFRDHRSVIVGSKIYLIGGSAQGLSSRTMSIDLTTKGITELSSLNHSRDRFAIGYYGGCIYVVGGESEDNSIIECYDIQSDNWKTVDVISTYIDEAGSTKIGDDLWVVSKNNGIYKFDMKNESITKKSNAPSNMNNVTATSINDSVYFYNPDNDTNDVFYAYAINNSGTELKSFVSNLDDNHPRGVRLISDSDRLFAIGGITSSDYYTGDHEYKPEDPEIVSNINVEKDDKNNKDLNISFDVPNQKDITKAEIRYQVNDFEKDYQATTKLGEVTGDIPNKTQNITVTGNEDAHYFIHIYTMTGAKEYSTKLKNGDNVQTIAVFNDPIISNIRESVESDREYENNDKITLKFNSNIRLDTDKSFVNFANIDSKGGKKKITEESVDPNIYKVEHTISGNNQVPNSERLIRIKAVPL